MDWLSELARVLRKERSILRVEGGGRGAVLDSYLGEEMKPPVRLMFDAEQLEQHLADMADDAMDVFPGDEPMRAAFKLFLVHVEEELQSHDCKVSELRIDDDGLRAGLHPDWRAAPDIQDAGPFEWSAYPPGTPKFAIDKPEGVSWLDYLIRDFAASDTVLAAADEPGRLLLTRYYGEDLAPPVTLVLTDGAMEAHLEALRREAAEQFPGDDPVQAAYRLFHLRFDQAMTQPGQVAELHVIKGRFRAVPAKRPD